VRITLAAVVVTATAMAISGWLLVRSVEEAQRAAIRHETANLLDQVAERLAAGVPPEATVRPSELTTNLVEIGYEDGSSIDIVPIAGDDEVGVGIVPGRPHSAQPGPFDTGSEDRPRPPISMSPTRTASPRCGTWPPAEPSTHPPAR